MRRSASHSLNSSGVCQVCNQNTSARLNKGADAGKPKALEILLSSKIAAFSLKLQGGLPKVLPEVIPVDKLKNRLRSYPPYMQDFQSTVGVIARGLLICALQLVASTKHARQDLPDTPALTRSREGCTKHPEVVMPVSAKERVRGQESIGFASVSPPL
jgi:hypothetical protein